MPNIRVIELGWCGLWVQTLSHTISLGFQARTSWSSGGILKKKFRWEMLEKSTWEMLEKSTKVWFLPILKYCDQQKIRLTPLPDSSLPNNSNMVFFLICINRLSLFLFKKLINFNWRIITLQYCDGFWHTLTWNSHGCTCVPHPEPPPTSFPTPSLWVVPEHWLWVPCFVHWSCTDHLFYIW